MAVGEEFLTMGCPARWKSITTAVGACTLPAGHSGLHRCVVQERTHEFSDADSWVVSWEALGCIREFHRLLHKELNP